MPKKVAKQKTSVPNNPDPLVTQIRKWQEQSQANVARWELNLLKFHKMRMRIKKVKNFPFVGCANLRMPTLETKLRKLKASLTNVIFGIRPVVQVIPTPSGTLDNALKVEKFLDHLIMDVCNLKPKVIIGIDQALEKGFEVLKPYWRYEEMTREEHLSIDDFSLDEVHWIHSANTTKDMIIKALIDHLQVDMNDNVKLVNMKELDKIADEIHKGVSELDVKLQDVLCNYPDVDLCMDERIYVPTDGGYDPNELQYIIHEFFLPLDTVKKNAEIKGWDTSTVSEVWAMKQINLNFKNIQITKDFREGIMRLQSPDQLVRIWEVYCWYDIENQDYSQINPSGDKTKCVITYAPDFAKILRKSTLPFSNGKFPFVKFFYELTDDRWFSHRGIPEMIEDLVKEIDIIHMQKLDSQTIRNAPIFLYRAGMVNNKAVQFIFGQGLPVNGMTPLSDVMAPLNNQNPGVDFSYKDEQMILESKIEEMFGTIDFSLQSMINKRQPRTLGEVNQQVQSSQTVFSLDADLFCMQVEDLFNWIWDLWCQYGDDEYEFAYFGKDGWEKIRLSREEIQGKYKIMVRGNSNNTNPQQRLQKAEMIMGIMENPILSQMGVITPQNAYNVLKVVLQEADIPEWEKLITMPKPPQQPPQPPPPVKINMEDLTPAQAEVVKQKYGIPPDLHGAALQHQDNLNEKNVDHRHKVLQAHQQHINNLQENAINHTNEKEMALLEMIRLQRAEKAAQKQEV